MCIRDRTGVSQFGPGFGPKHEPPGAIGAAKGTGVGTGTGTGITGETGMARTIGAGITGAGIIAGASVQLSPGIPLLQFPARAVDPIIDKVKLPTTARIEKR